MLTELFGALTLLLHTLNAPVYLDGSVPPAAKLPYCTLEIALPVPGGNGRVTLTGWRCQDAGHQERLAWGDLLLGCIPAAGMKLPLSCGTAVLYRARDAAPQCVHSGDAVGLSIPLTLQVMMNP